VSKETHYFVLISYKLAPELRGPYVGSDIVEDMDSQLYRAEVGADFHDAVMHFADLGDALCEYLLAVRTHNNRQGGNDD
jgi:hypothetical protein